MYAKWRIQNNWSWPRGWTLDGHTEKCLLAFDWLTEYNFVNKLYDIMSIERFASFDEFKKYCRLAIALHDIGKANSEFQNMIQNNENIYQNHHSDSNLKDILFQNMQKQRVRHETVSLMFLMENIEWVKAMAGEHYKYVLAAIYGHHIKTSSQVQECEQFDLKIYSNYIVDNIIKKFITNEKYKFSKKEEYSFDYRKVRDYIPKDFTKNNSLSYALKYILIICDTLGSMTSNSEHDIFENALKNYVKEILKGKNFNVVGSHRIDSKALKSPFPYQEECRVKNGSFIINIGCGGGKTATGFYACADAELNCSKNIVFTVPLTSASTQLYINVGNKTDGNRSSRSIIDKELFLGSSYDEDDNSESKNELLSSFENMTDEVTFATTDQILGLVAYSRKSIFWLLHLINSKVIFDEFHSYDKVMSFWFEEFLRIFPKIDVICMSATTTNQQEDLVRRYRPNVNIINNQNTAPLTAPRYDFKIIREAQAINYFDENKRTLWMVNTVGRAQLIAIQNPDALIFHARYKYKDKVERQKDFINSFKSGQPTKAVCTQIGEMSLDIYADQMITEFCPCADLIQRIGRASPRGRVPENITTIYCYLPESCKPYSDNDINECEMFVSTLLNKEWSLKDLIEHFKNNVMTRKGSGLSVLGMMKTYRLSTRNQSPTTNCILNDDLERIKEETLTNNKAIQKYEFSLYDNEIPKNMLTIFKYRTIVSKPYDKRLGVIK